MVFQMMPIPPIRGTATLNFWVLWGIIAFLLVLSLIVVLWTVWVMKSQQRTATQTGMNKAQRPEEVSLPAQYDENTQVPLQEHENARTPSLT